MEAGIRCLKYAKDCTTLLNLQGGIAKLSYPSSLHSAMADAENLLWGALKALLRNTNPNQSHKTGTACSNVNSVQYKETAKGLQITTLLN